MSRPAARPVRERTTACPTCEATPRRPCWRLGADTHGRGYPVPVHAARKRLESLLIELQYLRREAEGHPDRVKALDWRIARVREGHVPGPPPPPGGECSEHGSYEIGPDCPECVREVLEWTA